MPATLFRRVLLPALLLLAVGVGLGGYFETNDDAAIMLLLRGTTAAAPVTNLHLYFHGLSGLLAGLYRLAPAVPWYAVLLYGLLYAATAGAFTFLDRLLLRLPPAWRTAWLLLFFLTAWLEHGFWFNYVRVPVLLAGVGLLLAAQRPQRRRAVLLGLLAFGVAWLVRPSAALLGLLAAAPGAAWLAGRRARPVLLAAGLAAGLGAAVLTLASTPEAARYRRLDVLKSNLNDYQLYRLAPRSAADRLGLRAARRWLLADSALVNEALFQRAARPDAAHFLQHRAPAKLRAALQRLALDYFPLLGLLAGLLYGARLAGRGRRFWLAQAGYALLVLALGMVLKLPPRVALPLLDLWVLSTCAAVLPALRLAQLRRLLGALLLGLAVAAVPYGYKILHRRQLLQAEQRRSLRLQQQLAAPGTWLTVTDGLPYKSASAFRNPAARPARLLLLAGWTAPDPSQAAWRQQLTGTRDFSRSLRQLARRPGVAWRLSPAAAAVLNQQLARLPGLRVQLVPTEAHPGAMGAYAPRLETAAAR